MVLEWLVCCTVREHECHQSTIPCTVGENGDVHLNDETFFDCDESDGEFADVVAQSWDVSQFADGLEQSSGSAHVSGCVPAQQVNAVCSHASLRCDAPRRDCSDLQPACMVLKRTREEWLRRVEDLRTGKTSPEMEWATLPAARRFLKANTGDAKRSVKMFLQALEMRARHRDLFQTMRCVPRSDGRVLGIDLEGHPVVYMCARSQTAPLRLLYEQIIVTFEAACKLTSDEGTIAFVVDMHGLQPKLNADVKAIHHLAETLGTVFAERICRITIVDFARPAQVVWWMLKPMLQETTKKKFQFVSEAKARQLAREQYDDELYDTLCATFKINRDKAATSEQLFKHARRTSICDVTFGDPPTN